MAVLLFLVGLWIEPEILEGRLSSMDWAALRRIAAGGGVAVP